MPTYSYPGVYIEEKPSGPGPIRGVSPSAMGLAGWTDKGPVDDPILCQSFPEYSDMFGSFTAKGLAPTMAYAFFANGGGQLYQVRVTHDDAVNSYSDLLFELEDPEWLDNTAQLSGTYNLQLAHSPVIPGTIGVAGVTAGITFENAGVPADQIIMYDDGVGNLVKDAVLSGVASGAATGSIDYLTGEITVQLAVPGDYTGGVDDITCLYTYRVFRFECAWPGEAGDNYRVTVSGTPDYLVQSEARYSRFNVVVEEDVNADPTSPQWNTLETFEGLIFNDPNDPNYVVTVINDPQFGSKLISVTDYGNAMNPTSLQGVQQLAEDFSATQEHSDGSSPPVIYDGAWKGWSYRVNALGSVDGIYPTTLNAQFYFIERGLQIGVGANPAVSVPILTWDPAAVVPSSVAITCDLTITGLGSVITDDGLGNLVVAATNVGTVNYATGGIVIDVSPIVGETFVADSVLTMDCNYAEPVTVRDDGSGNPYIADPTATTNPVPGGPYAAVPSKFILDSGGDNSVDYDTGEFTLTWKIDGDPAAGPSGDVLYAPAGIPTETATYYTNPDTELTFTLANGDDGSATDSGDVIDPALAADYRGLWAFSKVDAIMNLVVADFQTDPFVADAVITYCEGMKDKFSILTYPHGLNVQEAANWLKFTLAKYSSYAALYGPHIRIKDPVTDSSLDVPCGGHVAGVYARTDRIRNVGEAPAGVQKGQLNWLEGLEQTLGEQQVGVLTQNKINALVDWAQTGRCVWGARSLDISGGEWPYVQQRRLFMFVEKSVYQATHVHVFENNGPVLWARIRQQVTGFLTTLFNQGYLAGSSPSQAFFVICDETNNPQETVDMGLVFCDVGIAPNKPAEFLVFRFQQKSL